MPDLASNFCRFGNARAVQAIGLQKIWAPGSKLGDTVTLTVAGPSSTTQATSVAGGTALAATLVVLPGQTIQLSEAFTVGSESSYASALTCSGNANQPTYTPGQRTGSLVIAASDTLVNCAFTNTPLTASVVLAKSLDPVLDPGRFDLTVEQGGSVVKAFADAGDGDATEPVIVNVGSTVTVSEAAGTDTDPAHYVSSLACDGDVIPDGDGSFEVPASAAGQTITCTFTNTRLRAQLLIDKIWVGPIDPTQIVNVGVAGAQGLTGSPKPNDGGVHPPALLDVYVGESVRVAERFVGGRAEDYEIDVVCGGQTRALDRFLPVDGDTPASPLLGADPADDIAFETLFQIPPSAAGGQVRCMFTNARRATTLTLQKSWVDGRQGDTARFDVDGLVDATATTTSPGGSTTASVLTTPIHAGEIVTISETLGGGGVYVADLVCTDASGLQYSAGATTGTYTVPSAPEPVTCTFTNTRQPDLLIQKQVASGPVAVGPGVYTVAYDISVTNPGTLDRPYTLTDQFAFAAGTLVTSVSVANTTPGSVAVDAAFDGAGNTTIATASLPAGSTHVFRVLVRVDVSGVGTETAFDCALDPGETGTGLLNRATVNPTSEACVEIPPQSRLAISKVVDQASLVLAADESAQLTYRISAVNQGPSRATGVVVTDTFPAGTVLAAFTTSAGSCTSTSTALTCTAPTLGVGESLVVTVTLQVPPSVSGAITNSAIVQSSGVDPVIADNSAAATTEVTRNGRLPSTGHGLMPLGLAACLLCAGAALTVIRRRPRAG